MAVVVTGTKRSEAELLAHSPISMSKTNPHSLSWTTKLRLPAVALVSIVDEEMHAVVHLTEHAVVPGVVSAADLPSEEVLLNVVEAKGEAGEIGKRYGILLLFQTTLIDPF